MQTIPQTCSILDPAVLQTYDPNDEGEKELFLRPPQKKKKTTGRLKFCSCLASLADAPAIQGGNPKGICIEVLEILGVSRNVDITFTYTYLVGGFNPSEKY